MHHRLGSTLVSLVKGRIPLIQHHKWNIRDAILSLAPPIRLFYTTGVSTRKTANNVHTAATIWIVTRRRKGGRTAAVAGEFMFRQAN